MKFGIIIGLIALLFYIKSEKSSQNVETELFDKVSAKNFVSELEKLDKTLSYYVYCRSGNRSGQACSVMQKMGFESTFNLVGGFLEWTGPTVTP